MVMVQTTLTGARVEIEKINTQVRSLKSELLLLQSAIYGSLGIFRRLGFGDEFNDILMRIQRIIAALNMLRLTLHAVQVAQAGAGPAGWLLAAIGVVGATLTVSDIVEAEIQNAEEVERRDTEW